MKKLMRLCSIIFIFVLLFSFTGCSGSGDQKYKSVELNAENTVVISIEKTFDKGQTVIPLASNIVETKEAEINDKLIFIGYTNLNGTIYLNGAQLPDDATNTNTVATYIKSSAVETNNSKYAFVGFLQTNEENASDNKLYTNKSSLVLNTQKAIFVEKDDEGNIPFPTMAVDGTNFSGWYVDASYSAGTRVANIEDLSNIEGFSGIVYARYLGYGEAAIVSVVCVLIVFSMLALLWLIVSLLKYVNKLKKPETKHEESAPVQETPRVPLKLEDIQDEDMMAAALVATIDYHEETKEDVRVVSIKEIK